MLYSTVREVHCNINDHDQSKQSEESVLDGVFPFSESWHGKAKKKKKKEYIDLVYVNFLQVGCNISCKKLLLD